jgi:adenylate cyclase
MAKSAYLETVGSAPRQIELSSTRSLRIGRGAQNDINLDTSMVSRNHALIQPVDADTFYLYDLGSQNGTFANRRPVTSPLLLRAGDQINIADVSLVFHGASETASQSTTETGDMDRTTLRVMVKVITVLVVDLRGFTEIASEINAVHLAEMMGEYFRAVGAILKSRKASTQKYIGDAVMATWVHEADEHPSGPILVAVDALARIDRTASELQHRFKLRQPVRVAAGLNTGLASIGNIGGNVQADYTALGDTVNMAFRLEKVTRDIGFEVAIGNDTASVLERIAGRPFLTPTVAVLKGYADPCRIYGADIRTITANVLQWAS